MEVPAPSWILRTACCKVGTSEENLESWWTSSSKAYTARLSPGRTTWRMKCAAASRSKGISNSVLRLESIMRARSSGCWVSFSNTSTFCKTPSSYSSKASGGRSGAGPARRAEERATAPRQSGSGWKNGREKSAYSFSDRFFRGLRRCQRRDFAFGPDSAVLEILLFPDGHGFLEGVNGKAASVEGGAAMRRTDSDEDAGFADFEASEAVDHGEAMNGKVAANPRADITHRGEGHRFVSFVLEIERGASGGMIADNAVEDDHGAVFGGLDVFDKLRGADGSADQVEHVIGKRF